jgi:copper chaperone CopZ
MRAAGVRAKRSSPSGGVLGVAGALAGGLLASSCCVIQLALNATSLGCVGFSALTPYRGFFRTLTGACLAYLLLVQGPSRRTLATVALSIALMVSQDAVAMHNSGALSTVLRGTLEAFRRRASSAADTGLSNSLPAAVAARALLRVKGLRCEACASRLRHALVSLDGVIGCTVSLGDGLVEVWSNVTATATLATGSGSGSGTTIAATSLMLPRGDALIAAVRAVDASYTAELLEEARCFGAAGEDTPCLPPRQQQQQQRKQQQQQQQQEAVPYREGLQAAPQPEL